MGIWRHKGFALLTFILVMIGIGAFGLSRLLDETVKDEDALNRDQTRESLLRAKEALLSYSAKFLIDNDLSLMGRLPCPDANNGINQEGSQDPACGVTGANSLGFFPYKTLGIGKLEDGYGECLWYVVSGSYKNSPDMTMINWDSMGQLQIKDEQGHAHYPADDLPVALIIAPGQPVGNQDRSTDPALPQCHANYILTNYLESGPNLDYSIYTPNDIGTVWSFLRAPESARLENKNINDAVIAITRKEYWDHVKKTGLLSPEIPGTPVHELTKKLAECLVRYSELNKNTKKLLPYAGGMILSDYQNRQKYKDKPGRYSGRFPQDIKSSDNRIKQVAGGDAPLGEGVAKSFVVTDNKPGFCKVKTGLDPVMWENWKDQFFYVVARDYWPDSPESNPSHRCAQPGRCLNIGGNSQVAAIVFFANDRTAGQRRDVMAFTDDNSATQRLNMWKEYLDGNNRHFYAGDAGTSQFDNATDDYAYCVFKQASGNLAAGPC